MPAHSLDDVAAAYRKVGSGAGFAEARLSIRVQ